MKTSKNKQDNMNKIKYSILFCIMVLLINACEKEKERITIKTDLPASVQFGNTDTLKFHIVSEDPLTRVDLSLDTILLARFNEETLGLNKIFDINFLFTPNKAGKTKMKLFVINKEFDTKNLFFTVEVKE